MGDDAVTVCNEDTEKNTIMYYVMWHNPPRSEQVRYMKLHNLQHMDLKPKIEFSELSDSRRQVHEEELSFQWIYHWQELRLN